MFLFELVFSVALELCDFASELEIERDHKFVLLADGLFVAGQFVHLVQIAQLIRQRLSEQPIVVLRGSNVLWEDGVLVEPGVCVLRVEPIVGALVLHDLDYSAPVDLPDILVVEVLVESGVELLILLAPPVPVLLQPPGVGEDLLAKGAFVLEVHFAHGLFVLL